MPIREIENLIALSNCDFSFIYSGRKFELRAEKPEEKETWMEALTYLIDHLTQLSPTLSHSINKMEFI